MERLDLKSPTTLSHKEMSSSEMKADMTHFCCHIDFKAVDDEACLDAASVEQCLAHMFNFVSADSAVFVDPLKGLEIKEKRLGCLKSLGWLTEHDVLHWKTCSEGQKLDAYRSFNAEVEKIREDVEECGRNLHAAMYIAAVLKSYRKTGNQHIMTSYMEALGRFFGSYLTRDVEVELPVCIRQTEVEHSHVAVISNPAGVFTRQTNGEICGNIVVQIYKPCQEVFCDEDSHLRSYLEESVLPRHCEKSVLPRQCSRQSRFSQECCRHHCVHHVAGQHVTQLLCEAQNNLTATSKNPRIGILAVNEFIYFSRLDVNQEQMNLVTGCNIITETNRTFDEGFVNCGRPPVGSYCGRPPVGSYCGRPLVVSYSNFRLDVTIPNHRMAFIMFLSKYLFSNE